MQLGGRNVLQGFDDFPRAPSAATLPQAPAGCVLTDHDWRPEYAGLRPEIRFASIVLERDHDKLLSSVVVSFTGYRSGPIIR